MFSKSESKPAYQYDYTIPETAVEQFTRIPNDYRAARTNSRLKHFKNHAPTSLGGTDTAERNRQLSFLEKMTALLKAKPAEGALKDIPADKIPLDKDLQLLQLRLLTMVGLYVKDDIRSHYPNPRLWSPRHSKLYYLIATRLNIVDGNRPEDNEPIHRETISQALMFFSDQASFHRANGLLKHMNIEPFTATEYQDFVRYLQEKAKPHEALRHWTEKPFEIAASYTLETAGEALGVSAGFLLGGVLSTSAPMIPVNNKAAKMVAQGMILAGVCSTMGAPIVAPIIAAKLLAVICEVTMALTLKKIGGVAGQHAGRAIGMPLDVLTRAGTKFGWDIYGRLTKINPCEISGIRLSDGARVVNGVVQVDDSTDPKDMGQIEFLNFDDQGNVTLQGQPIASKDELMEELIRTLKERGMMSAASTALSSGVMKVEEASSPHP